MLSIPQTSGIYKIVHLSTGRIYVGSAANLSKRYGEHWRDLRANRHANRYLQNAWNKYGQDAFSFVVIEEIFIPFLLEREQLWIDKLHACDRRKGFNLSPTAGSSRGVKHSEESRRRMGEGRKGAQVFTDEVRRVRSEDQKRLWNIPSYRERMLAASAKGSWVVVDPDGIESAIVSLSQFCRDHNLDIRHMSKVARGTRPRHKGWTCRRAETEV